MKFGSRGLGAIIFIVVVLLMLMLEALPHLMAGGPRPELSENMSFPEKNAIFGMQFMGISTFAKVWMAFQDIIIGAGLFFVLWRKEAQIYLSTIIASHVFLFVAIAVLPGAKLTLGLASFSHWLWIPALFVFVKAWGGLDKKTGYGTWVTIAIAQIIFSLIFDIPDGARFLLSLFN